MIIFATLKDSGIVRVGELEWRRSLVENRIDNLDQWITFILENKDVRDAIIIELFRMLKDSMKRKIKTLINIQKSAYL